MSYAELRTLRAKEKKCDNVVAVLGFPLFIALIAIMVCLVFEVQLDVFLLLATVIIGSIFGVIIFIFGCRGDNYRKEMEKYIISVIERLVKMNGVDSNNFQISCDKENVYRVIFSNQKINYDVLRSQVDVIFSDLNEISGRNIKVTLI